MHVSTVDCGYCGGDGLCWNSDFLGWHYCPKCNGTGRAPVMILGDAPRGRQLFYGALLCAAVAIALILMFASKL